MKKTAFLFPGQGSQAVGMGKSFYEQSEEARNIFKTADEVLGYSLSKLCFEGPEEELKLTQNTQPALLTVSTIAYRLLGHTPAVAAGHSLGEYSALVAAGALRFEDAVLLVHKRGKYMQEAVPVGVGGHGRGPRPGLRRRRGGHRPGQERRGPDRQLECGRPDRHLRP